MQQHLLASSYLPIFEILPVPAVLRTPVNTFASVDRPYKILDYLGATFYTTIQLSKRMLPDRQLITQCKYVIDMTALTQVCNRVTQRYKHGTLLS